MGKVLLVILYGAVLALYSTAQAKNTQDSPLWLVAAVLWTWHVGGVANGWILSGGLERYLNERRRRRG